MKLNTKSFCGIHKFYFKLWNLQDYYIDNDKNFKEVERICTNVEFYKESASAKYIQ